MIDLKVLRDDPAAMRASQEARGEDPWLVDRAAAADVRQRESLQTFESLRAEQKALGKQVAATSGEEKAALLTRTRALAAEVKAAQAAASEAEAERERLLYALPNLVAGAPAGGADDYVVCKTVGTARDFAAEGVAVQDHLALAEALGAIDVARGAKVSGARFYYLKGVGARLELAILNLAMEQAVAAGFTPMITPTLVRPDTMRGTGFLGEHADEVYRLERDDLYLVGTSEVALAGYHADEILDLRAGPLRYAGWSACYRREAGAAGRDTRGIVRVHQFHKIEMFSFCQPQDAAQEHQWFLDQEEQMLEKLELPYRVIDVAAGDLGTSAARKFDCEAWLPSQNRYLELTSASNCTTFQARRLGIRMRGEEGSGAATGPGGGLSPGSTTPVATLNGTLATTRWIVPLLENHQQADGSIRVPAALRPYLGGAHDLRP